jgi:hypothetical protein
MNHCPVSACTAWGCCVLLIIIYDLLLVSVDV